MQNKPSDDTVALVAAALVQAEMAARGPMANTTLAEKRKRITQAYEIYCRFLSSGRLSDPAPDEE